MALYISYDDTTKLDVDMHELIAVFEDAYRRAGSGGAVYRSRVRLVYPPLSDDGTGRHWQQNMRILPAILPGIGAGLRIGATKGRELGRGGYLIVLFDFDTMELKAIISDFLIHGIRSAVPDGVAAKYLAREDSSVLGVIGSGRIARWAARAVCAVRRIKKVKVYSPNAAHRRDFCRSLESVLGLDIEDPGSAELVVRKSDVVVLATAAREAVLRGEWLEPGSTVISNTPEELDTVSIKRAKLIVAFKDEVLHHLPPYPAVAELLARGELGEEDLSLEISDVILGRKAGRTSPDEIVTFLNSGCGLYDVAIGAYVFKKAQQKTLGTPLP
ncbi:MAG TPA: ornithine cyclodeaminase family protein [Candidatus Acidoferrales bacterium]|nr:ornithine cyclodeaminase family protein [Candidatus Acidoferrales bacterium]